MEGPARGSGSISLSFQSGDPAQNDKAEEIFDEAVTKLRHLDGGTVFRLAGSCPVSGSLSSSYTNDNAETFSRSKSASDVGG